VIDHESRTHRVGGDQDLKTRGEQVEHGLLDAHVGFDAADDHTKDAGFAPGGKNLIARSATKREFVHRRDGQTRREFGHRRAELFGVLLRGGGRDAENLRAVEQATGVPRDAVALGLHAD